MAAQGTSGKTVDFGAIEEGGGSRVKVPEGDYRVKITAVKHATSQSGNDMFIWTFKGIEGKLKGKELTDYTALTPKALWKLRDLMQAVAGKAPGGAVDIRKLLNACKKFVGSEMGVTLSDDEYTNDKGKTFVSSKVSDYVSLADLSDEAPEDDEDVEDEDDAEDEDTEDEGEAEDGLDDLDRAGLKKHIKDNKLDIAVKKSMSDDDLRAAIRDAGDEDDDEDEEEVEDVDLDDL